ncbi:reverse transcriptase domain-containing protein [Tanacetum coccineum]
MLGTKEGAFLCHMVSIKGIKACPEKVEAVMKLRSPQTLKEAQSLNGKLASLNRFLSKSTEKSLLFFITLKRCVKKSDFQWTPEAERAFQSMKQCIVELPMVTASKPKEELVMYLCAAREAVSVVLLAEMDSQQVPAYFVSRALKAPEISYNPMEKLVLAIVHAMRRLGRYFQAYPVVVITDQPIKQILSRSKNTGRMLKWKFELEAFDITYRPRTLIRGQILVDFITERPDGEDSPVETSADEVIPEPWTLFTDGSSCLEGSGAGLILTSPKGEEFTYALRFEFDASNNEEEYEALIAGLRITEQMGVKTLAAKLDSRLVVNQINRSYEAKEQSMIQYLGKAKALTSNFKMFSIAQGIDISGPFPEAQGKVRFLIVAIDYFTKWIEAKPVATITGNQVKKFEWDNIVCRFRLPGEIISNNGKQFRDNPFKDWCEKLNIKQRFASVKHLQTNGQVERANRSLREGIKTRSGEDNKN